MLEHHRARHLGDDSYIEVRSQLFRRREHNCVERQGASRISGPGDKPPTRVRACTCLLLPLKKAIYTMPGRSSGSRQWSTQYIMSYTGFEPSLSSSRNDTGHRVLGLPKEVSRQCRAFQLHIMRDGGFKGGLNAYLVHIGVFRVLLCSISERSSEAEESLQLWQRWALSNEAHVSKLSKRSNFVCRMGSVSAALCHRWSPGMLSACPLHPECSCRMARHP